MKSRYIGLDFGEKTIGVAVSGPSGKTAAVLETIRRVSEEALRAGIRRLGEIIREYGITDIILGYPKHMDNSLSARCEKTLAFKERLQRNFKSVNIQLWDERLSSRAAERGFLGKAADFKKYADEMAAVYILQGYLDYKNNTEEKMDTQEWDNEDSEISMFDDEGNETNYRVLASKNAGSLYLLVEEILEDSEEPETDMQVAEVLHFKCVATEGEETEEEEMVLELVDEEHEDFDKVFLLFKDEYEALGIEIDER